MLTNRFSDFGQEYAAQRDKSMAEKSILLAVAEPLAQVEITQALGDEWEATSVSSEIEASEQLDKGSFDAFLADFNFGSPDASELLNEALEKRPETVRFLLAYEADLALVAAKVNGRHRILPKPLEPDSLKSRIENGVAEETSKTNQTAEEGSPEAPAEPPAPAVPAIYAEILEALAVPGTTEEQVGELISRDEELTAELLGLTRSAYLGLRGDVNDPVEAVGLLGFGVVKGLVKARQFLAEHSRLNPGYLSLDQIWEHSKQVARLARDLVLFETRDQALAAEALTAGLVHDLGKIVLCTNFDDLYGRVHSLGSKQPVPLWDIEKEIFGANHGEIGGCLVGMWDLPGPVVEATALHHEPPKGEHDQLTALAAVHVANVLAHEIAPGEEGFVGPRMDTALLYELGLLQRLPVWRAAIAKGVGKPQGKSQSTEGSEWSSIPPVPAAAPPPRSANQLPGTAGATRTTTSGRESDARRGMLQTPGRRQSHWVYAAVGAGVLIFLAMWFETLRDLNSFEPVYARTPVVNQMPVVVSPAPAPSPALAPSVAPATAPTQPVTQPAAAPQPAPSVAVSVEASATNVSFATVPEPAIAVPGSEPASVGSTSLPAAKPAISAITPKTIPAGYRVYGIIYSTVRPAAIVNGETVHAGERINGATVVDIGRTTVTLLVNGQRKTYVFR
jgi:HD-like signal output (HDOD) protein